MFERERLQMMERQIHARGVRDERVLKAILSVPRHAFVPPAARAFVYQDNPLPIGHGQTISQPYIVAYMTEALALQPSERVLEIGTGSGYQAAVLSKLAHHVDTIEIVPELAQAAKETLSKLGFNNVSVRTGDGYEGWPEEAPFDAIMVTAAPEAVPQKLIGQLKEDGGRMIVPVGSDMQELYLITKSKGQVHEKKLLPVKFVPMVSEDDHPS